jgi:DedD protein
VARPISDEELQLKKRARRRLVGAIVLVAIMAVVLPMVLDSEPEPRGQKIDIHIPSPDSGEFKPGSSTAGPGVAPKSAPESASRPDTATPTPSKSDTPARVADGKDSLPAKTPESPVPAKAAEAPASASSATDAKDSPKSASSAAATKTPPGSGTGAYVVQVAALSDTAKAKALEKRMAGAGLKTYTEVVSTPGGEVTRVRAGPYATRDAAEKARAQLKKAGLDGKIVPK